MSMKMELNRIGRVQAGENDFTIHVDPDYSAAMMGLEGYSHLQVVFWADRCDTPQVRKTRIIDKLFKKGPDTVGVFATRAPARPNPLLISIIQVLKIDYTAGIITTPFIDVLDGTPVVDIKPYNRMERVQECRVPGWCEHWPRWYEDAAEFNWHEEIYFPQDNNE